MNLALQDLLPFAVLVFLFMALVLVGIWYDKIPIWVKGISSFIDSKMPEDFENKSKKDFEDESETVRKNEEKSGDTFRPEALAFLFVIWNMVCISGMAFNGGLGRIKTPLSMLMMGMSGILLIIYGIGPLFSLRLRRLLCQPDGNIYKTKRSLLLMGAAGIFVFANSLLAMLASLF